MSSQTFNDSFPGVGVTPPQADTITFNFDMGVPDVPMPPAGVQYRVVLLRIAGQKGAPRDWELAELKIGSGGLVLELDGHGSNRRTVEPVKAPFQPAPGTFLHCSVHYNATTGEITASVGGVTLSGTTALRAGGRTISATFGVLSGEGGPALTYPHGWSLDLSAGSSSSNGSNDIAGTTKTPPPAPSGGGSTIAPKPWVSAALGVLLQLFLEDHGSTLTPEQQAAVALLLAASGK